MSLKAHIQYTTGFSDMLAEKYLGDLPPEALYVRPVAGMNHLAWQIGHLILVEHKVVEGLRPGSCPALPEGFDAQHSKETTGVDDPAAFLTKDQYLALWKAQRDATNAVLASMSDEELAAENPVESMRQFCPTVGAMMSLPGIHTIVHSGQFVPVRRKEALPIVF